MNNLVMKVCTGCQKIIDPEINIQGYKRRIRFSPKQWAARKFCTLKCQGRYYQRQKRKNEPERTKEYYKNYYKNMDPETKKNMQEENTNKQKKN